MPDVSNGSGVAREAATLDEGGRIVNESKPPVYTAEPYGGSVLRWAEDIIEHHDTRDEAELIREMAARFTALLGAAADLSENCHHHPDVNCKHQRALSAAIARARGGRV